MDARLGRTERVFITLFVILAWPLSFFVSGWWGTAALVRYAWLPMGDRGVAIGAFVGLAIGVLIAAWEVRRPAVRVYARDIRLLVPLYFFWSAVALALFMGLPFGVVALGVLAGIYVGRRERHNRRDTTHAARAARQVGIFAAAVTGAEMSVMGLLALREGFTMRWLLGVVGLERFAANPGIEGGLIAIGCVALVVIQYWLARFAALRAFGLGHAGSATA